MELILDELTSIKQKLREAIRKRPVNETNLDDFRESSMMRMVDKEEPLRDVSAATRHYDRRNIIKEGGSGKLYKEELSWEGRLMNFAVWRLDRQYRENYIDFRRELEILSNFKHDNISSIFEYFDEDDDENIIIYNAFHGNLQGNLKNPALTWSRRLQICLGVARALNYIHNQRLVHCDINSSKILLDEDWEPKIFGFELCTEYPQNWMHRLHSSRYLGTTTVMTPKYDVYLFGVLLFEVLCGKKPKFDEDGFNGKIDDNIDSSLRKHIGSLSMKLLKNLANSCLDKKLVKRPSMNQIVNKLEEALKLQLREQENLELSTNRDEGRSTEGHQGAWLNRLLERLANLDEDASSNLLLDFEAINQFSDNKKENEVAIDLTEDITFDKIADLNKEHDIFIDKKQKREANVNEVIDVNDSDDDTLKFIEDMDVNNVKYDDTVEKDFSTAKDQMTFLKIPLSEIESATNNFDEAYLVGMGEFGTVYRAKLDVLDIQSVSSMKGKSKDEVPMKISKTVAIKRLSKKGGEQAQKGFLTEIELLTSCRHPNVVSLLGFSREANEMILVYEFASKGSLSDYLLGSELSLSWSQRLQICLQVAHGINYLHTNMEGKPSMMHRDIKSENILLDENLNAKVAEFGLSTFHHTVGEKSIILTKNLAGTGVYIDPEYQMTGRYKKESDIYSFGVVLFEVLSGKMAYDGTYLREDDDGLAPIVRTRFKEGTLMELIDPKMLEEDDEHTFTLNRGPTEKSFDLFSEVGYECLAKTQAKRPKMEVVIKKLKDALDVQGKTMKLSRFRLSSIEDATQNFDKTYYMGLDTSGNEVYKAQLDNFESNSLLATEGKNNGETPKRRMGVIIKRILGEEGFFSEIEMHARYKHPNIVPLLGFCYEDDNMLLVYEHDSDESLDNYLRNTDNMTKHTWIQHLNQCLGIAHGLNHLHTLMDIKQEMIHVDIRSANILLGKSGEAKIAYFGFSKLLQANQEASSSDTTNNNVRTKVYRCPAEYQKTGELKKQSDIYSFGVVLFEIFCGRLAYDPVYTVKNDNGLAPIARQSYSDGTIKEMIDPALKEESVEDILTSNIREPILDSLGTYLRIANQCLAENQAERPTMQIIIEELEKALSIQVDDDVDDDDCNVSIVTCVPAETLPPTQLDVYETKNPEDLVLPPTQLDVYQTKNPKDLVTHNSALNAIIAALEDESKQIIGIYGLGGVGKTTLAKEVVTRVKNNLFADVAFTTVSQKVNVEKIKKDLENATKRMMKGEKILIILDDVWETLNLEGLGIQCGNNYMNCKILLTSRSEKVCQKMSAQIMIGANPLPTEEAWSLFKRVVGEKLEMDANLKPLALKVVEECGGLPLLIQAIGNALKDESIKSWESALSQLKQPAASETERDIDKAFTRLQLSYEYLKSEVAKSCFLLCSFFAEDDDISLEHLVCYGVGLKMFDSMEDAREGVQNAVNILISSGLLLNGKWEGYTKMHDVVRDVALLIASKGENKFLVEAGKGLKEWLPGHNNLERYTGISLMNNKISKLPDYEVHLSSLDIFLVNNNPLLRMMSDEFIKGMKEVKVLDMGWCLISHLPQSLKLLTKLRMLNLEENYFFHEISILGEMKELEILILNRTGIKEIPIEIGWLVNLRRLEVSRCRYLTRVTQGVISKLKSLEELCIDFSQMSVGVDGCSAEVMTLSNLTYLDLVVKSCEVIPEGFNSEKLKGFVIQIGEYHRDLYRGNELRRSDRYLIISSKHLVIPLLKRIKKFIEVNCPITILNGIQNLNNIMPDLYCGGFNKLEHIQLNYCHNVSCLVEDGTRCDQDEGKTEENFFKELKHLKLWYLDNLEVLWEYEYSLTNLVSLFIEGCDRLERVFTVSVAQSLVNLNKLDIKRCDGLQEVIWGGGGGGGVGDESGNVIVFPYLATISLSELPILKRFFNSARNCSIEYPSLVYVKIHDCQSMKIWGPGNHKTPDLKSLEMDYGEPIVVDGPLGINEAVKKSWRKWQVDDDDNDDEDDDDDDDEEDDDDDDYNDDYYE